MSWLSIRSNKLALMAFMFLAICLSSGGASAFMLTGEATFSYKYNYAVNSTGTGLVSIYDATFIPAQYTLSTATDYGIASTSTQSGTSSTGYDWANAYSNLSGVTISGSPFTGDLLAVNTTGSGFDSSQGYGFEYFRTAYASQPEYSYNQIILQESSYSSQNINGWTTIFSYGIIFYLTDFGTVDSLAAVDPLTYGEIVDSLTDAMNTSLPLTLYEYGYQYDYSYDSATGTFSYANVSGHRYHGNLTLTSLAPVPEPSTLLLLGGGLAGLAFYARRRRKE